MSLARRILNAGFHAARSTTRNGLNSTGSVSATAQLTSGGKLPYQKNQSKSNESSKGSAGETYNWPRKIFSGIQPTGALHFGNYLGAVRKWVELQDAGDDVTICIVDMHSITMPHNPPVLRENIFEMAATLLACGLDPDKTTLFVQSAVLEHCELNWILNSMTTMPRLAQLPQFKEKSKMVREIPLGLYVYPVLQAADIMLYKATHVPVGADQVQHIQLAQHLARSFNTRYGVSFPVCQALIEETDASRVLSLRDPSKKMSKSEANPKGTIFMCDPAEVVTEKIKKAVTDFTSDITYNPKARPGVSNLVNIHAQVTNKSIKAIVNESSQLDTAKYKERVAEAVNEHLSPIRDQVRQYLSKRNELVYMLHVGAERARQTAQQTMSDVKQRLGLGTNINLPDPVVLAPLLIEKTKTVGSKRITLLDKTTNAVGSEAVGSGVKTNDQITAELSGDSTQKMTTYRRIVPVQRLRVEKARARGPPKHVFKIDNGNLPSIGFRAPNSLPGAVTLTNEQRQNLQTNGTLGYSHNSSALATVTSAVNAANKEEDYVSTLANSVFYKAAVVAYNTSSANINSSSHKVASDEVENPIDSRSDEDIAEEATAKNAEV